jgi:hypothetical protein
VAKATVRWPHKISREEGDIIFVCVEVRGSRILMKSVTSYIEWRVICISDFTDGVKNTPGRSQKPRT